MLDAFWMIIKYISLVVINLILNVSLSLSLFKWQALQSKDAGMILLSVLVLSMRCAQINSKGSRTGRMPLCSAPLKASRTAYSAGLESWCLLGQFSSTWAVYPSHTCLSASFLNSNWYIRDCNCWEFSDRISALDLWLFSSFLMCT